MIRIFFEQILNKQTRILGQEKYMIERYVNEMTRVEKLIRNKIVWRGLVNSVAQSVPFLAYAVALCYGGYLVATEKMEFQNVIK